VQASKYRFWFYAQYRFYEAAHSQGDQVVVRKHYHVRVFAVTKEKITGGIPDIRAKDLPHIKENIRQHFSKYTLYDDAISTPDAAPSAIVFDWGLR
jgi:hypothetical protein